MNLLLFQLQGRKQISKQYMNSDLQLKVTYRSSPNIAWVKYWGKYDEDFILPINDSLGITLSTQDISTQTTVFFSKKQQQNTILLNNNTHPVSRRIQKMFELIKNSAYQKKYRQVIDKQQWKQYHFRVQSNNSFPTASGMASSASGLACLASALNGLFQGIMSQVQLSELARLGSGSASRSIYGGLVRWRGVPEKLITDKIKPDHQLLQKLSKQCISFTTVSQQNLRQIKVLILLANNKQKQVSSTAGMATSVKSSQLIQYRNSIASKRIQSILMSLKQLQDKNIGKQRHAQIFNSVVENIIKDSNQFHAICLDTYPPIFYLNQFSKQIIYMIDHIINPVLQYKVAYTFDAGPHAFLFMHQKSELIVLKYFYQVFSLTQKQLNNRAIQNLKNAQNIQTSQLKAKKFSGQIIKPFQLWSTSVGSDAYKVQ